MDELTVRFLPYGREARVPSSATLLDAARQAGIPLASSCGGEGTCGKCRLIVRKGRVQAAPAAALTTADSERGYVLACQTRALDDL